MFDDFSDDYGEGPYSGYDYSLPEDFNLDIGSLGSNADLGLSFDWGNLTNLVADPNLFAAFAEANPEDAALLKDLMGGDYGFAPVGADTGLSKPNKGGTPLSGADLAIALGEGREVGETTGEGGFTASKEDQTQAVTDSSGKKAVGAGIGLSDTTGTKSLIDRIKDITGVDAGDLAKYGLLAGIAKMAYDDAAQARKEARGVTATGGYAEQVTRTPSGSKKLKKVAMGGGIGSLEMARGGRTLPPRYLDGHSDGMEDKVPAHIDGKRPAALSDGEFVIPADVVSHLGNGNSNAGAKRLYEMMDRIRTARTGNHKQGKQINPDKFMPR